LDIAQRDAFQILVIDDDPLVQRVVARAIAGPEFTVTTASSASEAAAMLQRDAPDLVILDIGLPDGDGSRLCREIRRERSPEDLPILMLTGQTDDDAIEAAFDAGATDFLTKPVSVPLLRQRLRFALRAAGAFQRVNSNERRLARGHELAQIGQFEWHEAEARLDYTPQALRILGAPASPPTTLDELIDRYIDPDDRADARALFSGDSVFDSEIRLVVDGARHTIRTYVERGSRPNGPVLSVTMHDVTEFIGDRVHKLAHYDGVTGLPNRQLFEQRLDAALRDFDAQRFAVLFVDIDGFKATNDALGHLAGDELLRLSAERLLASLRLNDTIGRLKVVGSAGRWGGDEFAVLVGPILSRHDVERVAQRILKSAESPVQVGGKDRYLRLSIGVALSPDHGRTRNELMRNADRAMYEAKREGGNRMRVFEPLMESRARRRSAIEADVAGALQAGQLHLVYQPRFALDTLAIRGAEALLRWTHPVLGVVPPGEFIPVAERTRAILAMGRWVIAEAAAELARWRSAGHAGLVMSMNLSPLQLQEPDSWTRSFPRAASSSKSRSR
jgi:diguanylate cyclase (GGDEF)-like protein